MRTNSLKKYILWATFACVLIISPFSCESDLLSDPGTEAPEAPEEPEAPADETADLTGAPTVVSGLTTLAISFTTENAATAKIEYGTASGVYGSAVSGDAEASASHTITLSGLSQGTVYYYRVVAYLDGEAFPSDEYTATTTSEVAPTAAQKARGIWLIGGLSGNLIGSTVAEVDLFDPVTGNWYPAVTSLQTPVSFAGYAAYDGKLFVIGGFNALGNVTQLTQIYDIGTNNWSTGDVLNLSRANIHASVLNGKIYVAGGTTSNASATYAATNNIEEYSVSGNNWESIGTLAAAGSDRNTYAANNTVFNIGGRSTSAAVVTTHDGFVPDPTAALEFGITGATEVALAAGNDRTGMAGACYMPANAPGSFMLVGGVRALTVTTNLSSFISNATTAATLSNIVLYIPEPFVAPATWNTATATYPMNIAFASPAVSTASSTARLYVFGGTTQIVTTLTPSGQALGYWTNVPQPPAAWTPSWTPITMPRGRWGHGAVTLNQ